MDNEVVKLIELCKTYDKLYIYGAGRNASTLYTFLAEHNIAVTGFIVSDMEGNQQMLFSLPVIPVTEFWGQEQGLILVSGVIGSKMHKAVFECLVKNKIHNAFFIKRELIMKMNNNNNSTPFQIQDIFQDGIYYMNTEVPIEKGITNFSMTDANGEEYHWRFHNKMILDYDISNIADVFPDHSALEEFEDLYGRYLHLKSLKPTAGEKRKSCIIYMAKSHADKAKNIKGLSLPRWVIPLQVGAALADKQICGFMDNMGDNISERNEIFSECTGLYWMWKNAPRTDYIGLCHYRRHFKIAEQELDNLLDSDVDILATTPAFIYETNKVRFLQYLQHIDYDMLLEAIEHNYPEYISAARKFLQSRFCVPCNLAVMRWELFQEYAEYVFAITFEIERFYDELGFIRNDRYMGYIVECLLGIFIVHNKERLKVAYTDVIFYE